MTIEDFLDLVSEECGGDRKMIYREQQTYREMRAGQAFMNALRGTPYYDQLTGSLYDPFHSDHPARVARAIEFLTTK